MIKVTVEKVSSFEESIRPLLQFVSDKVARARPDRGNTATLAYVTLRRMLAKDEIATGDFDVHMSNEAARNMRTELRRYHQSLKARDAIADRYLLDLQGTFDDALALQKEEMDATARSDRRAAARGGASSVREQRPFR